MKNKKAVLLAAMFLMGFLAPAQNAAKGPEGSWQGVLLGKLHLVLTIVKSSDGYKAVLDSVDQHATIPADKVTFTGDSLHMDFNRVNGLYDGTLSKDADAIAGTWTQNGMKQPLDFKRAEASAAKQEAAAPAPAQQPLTAPIDVTVPIAPIAFHADNKTDLVYELHIASFSRQTITLTHVDVLSAAGASLEKLEQGDLFTNVSSAGNADATGMEKLNLGAGQVMVVYIWVSLDNGAPVPAALEHSISVKVGSYPEPITAKCARITVGREVATIAPPLRGDNWQAANGPSNASIHRRALIPIDGRARIGQRFAIDWIRLNSDGKTHSGDEKDNRNYRAYGSEALAVADGTVIEVKDGIPENVPGLESRAVTITLETIAGNHVVLDIGHGRFAFYAHLQPGSLKVKTGDHVKRGQVLGLVGNSGNSTEPHLHFHLADSKSALGSEGLPYALDSFDAKTKSGDVRKHKQEIPLEDELVTFEK